MRNNFLIKYVLNMMVYMWRMYVFCQIFLIKPPCWCPGIKKACQHRLVGNKMIPVLRWRGLIAKVDLKVQVISKSIKFHPQKRCYNVAHECLTSAKKHELWKEDEKCLLSGFDGRCKQLKNHPFFCVQMKARFRNEKENVPCPSMQRLRGLQGRGCQRLVSLW